MTRCPARARRAASVPPPAPEPTTTYSYWFFGVRVICRCERSREYHRLSAARCAHGVRHAWHSSPRRGQPLTMTIDKRGGAGPADRERLNRPFEIEVPWAERERLDR